MGGWSTLTLCTSCSTWSRFEGRSRFWTGSAKLSISGFEAALESASYRLTYVPSTISNRPRMKIAWKETCKLQWGSEIPTHLDLEWSRRGWFENGPNFEWDLEIPTNGHYFVQNHLKSKQKHPDFEWSSFQMVGTIVIAIVIARPFWKQDHFKSDLQKIWTLSIRSPSFFYLCCKSFSCIFGSQLDEDDGGENDTNHIANGWANLGKMRIKIIPQLVKWVGR